LIDVAIVGCGPTGALLGNLLGTRGLQVIILEKQSQVYDLPRAVHFDGEAMRIFQSAGLADKIKPWTRVNPGMLFKDTSGNTMVDWSRNTSIGPMGWHESYRFHQPDLEKILREGLQRYQSVELRSGVRVHGVSQNPNSVSISTTMGEFKARYVVACDGAESSVRGLIGSTTLDLGFQERWLVVDLQLTKDRPELGDYSVQFCDPNSPATYVRGVGERRRWELRLKSEDPNHIDENTIWQRLKRWISPHDAILERSAVYTFRSQITDCWQSGRVFLAGDAAHQMPPFMGQGMVAGVRDVSNLAWKLAAVCTGADNDVLKTYETERKPNTREFVDLSVQLGQLINQTAAGQQAQKKMSSIWPTLGSGLGRSDDKIAGTLVPQIDRADDKTSNGFYVLTREAVLTELTNVTNAPTWLQENQVFAVIVRPDGYALASVKDQSELNGVLERYLPLIRCLPARKLN